MELMALLIELYSFKHSFKSIDFKRENNKIIAIIELEDEEQAKTLMTIIEKHKSTINKMLLG